MKLFRNGDQQVILSIDKTFALVIGRREGLREVDGILGAGFLAEAAEDATQHVDLVAGCVLFFPVEMFLARLPLGGLHSDGFGGAGDGAKAAGRAALPSLLVPVQDVQAPEYRAEGPLLLRVVDGSLLFEQVP